MMHAVCFFLTCMCIFFVKQKTAYEMRISDWSSDVCSSDLLPPPPEPKPVTITADDLIRTIAGPDLSQPATELTGPPPPAADEREEIVITVLREMVDDPDSSDRPVAVLFQDFQVRCRMHRLTSPACDLPEFRRRLAMAKAGFFDRDDARLPPVLAIAGRSEEHTSEPFLLI